MRIEETRICILCRAEHGHFCESKKFNEDMSGAANCDRFEQDGKDPESFYVPATKVTIFEMASTVDTLA